MVNRMLSTAAMVLACLPVSGIGNDTTGVATSEDPTMKKISSEKYYVKVFTGTLEQEEGFMGGTANVLKNNQAIVGIVEKTEGMPGRGLLLLRDTCDSRVTTVPDVLVPGRRYLVLVSRAVEDGNEIRVTQVIDCDQSMAEAAVRAQFRVSGVESRLPRIDVARANASEWKKWVGAIGDAVAAGRVNVADIAGVLGEPMTLEYRLETPWKAKATYILTGKEQLLPAEVRGTFERRSCPRITVTVDRDKVVSVQYDVYAESQGGGPVTF